MLNKSLLKALSDWQKTTDKLEGYSYSIEKQLAGLYTVLEFLELSVPDLKTKTINGEKKVVCPVCLNKNSNFYFSWKEQGFYCDKGCNKDKCMSITDIVIRLSMLNYMHNIYSEGDDEKYKALVKKYENITKTLKIRTEQLIEAQDYITRKT